MRRLTEGKYLGTTNKSREADGVIISETEYREKVYDGWHFHENCHLVYVLNGGSEVYKTGDRFEEVPGQLAFYPGHDRHKNINTKLPTKVVNVEIGQDFIDKYGLDFLDPNLINLVTPGSKFTFLKLLGEAEKIDEGSAASIHILLLSLLNHSFRDTKSKPGWIEKLVELLHDRWNEDLTLTEMARFVGIHPVTLSKYFPRYFSHPLSEYIQNIRIDKAITLITTTDATLTDIAQTCAFYDQSHFIRCFKNKTGFLPGKLRKKSKTN